MKKTLTSQRAKLLFIALFQPGRNGFLTRILMSSVILLTPVALKAQAEELFTLDLKNVTISQLIETVQGKSGYSFFYKDNEINKNDRVSVQVNNGNISQVLAQAFDRTNVAYRVQGKSIILNKKEAASAQSASRQVTVKGVVTTTTGQPMAGITVMVPDTNIGVITDRDGWYMINVPGKDSYLEFRFIGYDTQKILVGERTAINVALEETTSEIDAVVVVGYGNQKKVTVTGSVASVNIADMKTSVPNLSNALQGKVAGIISVQASGEPGYDNSTFTIRGIGTFTGNTSPLVIVDGVQRDDVNSSYSGAYNNIDPEDIASISLLKDASATAMYGAKGANGVLIITTKRGQVGKPKISIKVESGLTSFTKTPSMLDGVNYMKLYNEGRRNNGYAESYSEAQIRITESGLDPYIYPNVNWVDEVYKKFSSVTNVNMNLNGGSDIVRYYLSASFYNQEGQYNVKKENDYNPNLNYKRYDFRSNVDVNVTNTTLLQMNLSAILVDARYPGISAGDLWYLSYATSPIAHPVRYPGGEWAGPLSNSGANPKNEVQNSGYSKEFRPAVQSVFTLNQQLDFITPGLSAYARFSFDSYSQFKNKRTGRVDLYNANSRDAEGNLVLGRPVREGEEYLGYEQESTGERVMYFETNIAYEKLLGDHRLSGMVLYNMRNRLLGTAGSAVASIPYRNQALAGRLSYSYSDKYLFEVNGSYTGSENFASGNRFGFFPAASAGWVISKESFFNDNNALNLLKLRASYGVVGNDNIGADNVRFPYLTQYKDTEKDYGFGSSGNLIYGLTESMFGVTNLTWERSYKTNVGLELGLLDRINVIAEFFTEKRKDILITRSSLPGFAGYSSSIYANMGRMNNKGAEVNIEYNDKFGEVGVRLFGNTTYSKNKIVDWDQPDREFAYQDITGTKYGEFYGFISEGLFTQEEVDAGKSVQFGTTMKAGDVKYRDLNNDGVIDADDQTYLGKSWFPTWSYGFGFGLNWKNFDLSMFFQGVADVGIMANGSKITTDGRLGADGVGIVPFSGMGQYPHNVMSKVLDRWTEENPSQDVWYPRLSYNASLSDNNYRNSTWWMKNGNYMRLKQASLGYTLKTTGLEKAGLNYLYFYVSGVNLLTFTSFKVWEPELGSNGATYPLNRMVTIGVRAQF